MVQRLRQHDFVSAKILLVEDNKYNLRALTLYLEVMGLSVEQAQDGFEALRKLDHDTFDVVVSDIRMPRLNGLDLARRIHETYGRIPIVLMTGDPTARTNESVNGAGVSKLLIKPFIPRELVTTIHKAVAEK
jgi:two-component system, NtrC family, response regulator GlrR